ncbi:hypothetical protein QR680_010843 [Steinernema hermaphroditum]|uniref:Uncharacterized protein n=1 Tax=Steinernema hermaphroditum TaxID=289476 RepID=A0AA39IQB5_9BILA|nr:hypothetical protein QR680_010843 [Steinernema hermaphroditum]
MNIEIETEKVAARQTYLVTSQALESDPRTASVAHQQALRVVSANARSEEEAHNVRLNFPSKRTARRTYQNHAGKAYPKSDSGKIPECFKTVLSPAVGHLEQTENQWLLHSEEDYSVHIFCDAQALRNLWRVCLPRDLQDEYILHKIHQLQQDPELWEDVKVREFAGYITSYWMPLIPYISYGPIYDGPTTTNHVEGFHRRFHEIFGSQHPPVNVFLHHFRLFALENFTEGHQLQEGHRLIARRRKIDIEKSIKAGHAAMILEAHLMDSPSASSTFVDRFCRYHAYLALPKRRLEQIHDGVLELHGFTEENERQVHSETEEDDSDEDESTEEDDSDEDEGFNEGPLEDDNFEGVAVDSALAPVQVTQSSSNIAPYLEEAALSWNISVVSFPELFIAPSDLFSDDVAHDDSLFHY